MFIENLTVVLLPKSDRKYYFRQDCYYVRRSSHSLDCLCIYHSKEKKIKRHKLSKCGYHSNIKLHKNDMFHDIVEGRSDR